jgi:hypothetical protein
MTPFATDQIAITALLFLLGLLIGMFAMAGGRWKRAYQEQVRENEKLRSQITRLESEAREMESLRNAATKSPGRAASTEDPI